MESQDTSPSPLGVGSLPSIAWQPPSLLPGSSRVPAQAPLEDVRPEVKGAAMTTVCLSLCACAFLYVHLNAYR